MAQVLLYYLWYLGPKTLLFESLDLQTHTKHGREAGDAQSQALRNFHLPAQGFGVLGLRLKEDQGQGLRSPEFRV